MTRKEQIKFVKALIFNIQEDILEKSDKFPENWDGIELRWYIAERFDRCVFGDVYGSYRKKKKEYKNDLLVNNL